GRLIEAERVARFHGLVGHAGDGWRGGVHHADRLTALRAVTASVGRTPGACRTVTATSGVRHRAQDADAVRAAHVRSRWLIEAESVARFYGLVGHAGDGWRGGVHHADRLTALRAVTASVGRTPGACRTVTATSGVRHRSDDADAVGAANVSCRWLIKAECV